ncbi:comK family protein [Firmicutes bacterium CAG:460]|nr:comK family protein [Firmicutes bacterium CAG:460]
MFKISNNTLFMEFDGSNTLVMEADADYVFDGDVINTILDESCIYYGSSLNGRIKGSKNIIGSYYKLPVIVSERNNIVFFPLKKGNCWWWINFNSVKYFEKTSNGVLVSFKNELKKYISVSYTIFNNQMLKCSRLWLVYTTR